MELTELQEYFETYVENYKPYKDNPLYKEIVDFLLNYYLVHSYAGVPDKFKQAFENYILPTEFYDSVLLSNGFPQEVLDKISFNDKHVLLNSFMDFNKYKGSLKLLHRSVNVFNDHMNVYELFIDRRDDEWVFVPYFVAGDPDLEDEKLSITFPYDEIYFGTYHYFITKEELEELYQEGCIILPIKSNLLFLDYVKVYDSNPLYNLISTIVLREFRNEKLVIYFQDGQYQLSLEKTYKLWYYILFKTFNINIEIPYAQARVIMSINTPDFPYTVEDIETLLQEYDDLGPSGKDIREYYYNKIQKPFETYQLGKSLTVADLRELYSIGLGEEILDYVDGRIGADPELKKQNVNQLLGEIFNSLMTWSVVSTNKHINNYFHYLADILPQIAILASKTPTYVIIDFIKPYHVELVDRSSSKMKVNDKFNSLFTDHEYSFMIQMFKHSIVQISDNIVNLITLPLSNNIKYVHARVNTIKYYFEQLLNLTNDFSSILKYHNQTVFGISDTKVIYHIGMTLNTCIKTLTSYYSSVITIINDHLDLTDLTVLDLTMEELSVFSQSHIILQETILPLSNNLEFINGILNNLSMVIIDDDFIEDFDVVITEHRTQSIMSQSDKALQSIVTSLVNNIQMLHLDLKHIKFKILDKRNKPVSDNGVVITDYITQSEFILSNDEILTLIQSIFSHIQSEHSDLKHIKFKFLEDTSPKTNGITITNQNSISIIGTKSNIFQQMGVSIYKDNASLLINTLHSLKTRGIHDSKVLDVFKNTVKQFYTSSIQLTHFIKMPDDISQETFNILVDILHTYIVTVFEPIKVFASDNIEIIDEWFAELFMIFNDSVSIISDFPPLNTTIRLEDSVLLIDKLINQINALSFSSVVIDADSVYLTTMQKSEVDNLKLLSESIFNIYLKYQINHIIESEQVNFSSDMTSESSISLTDDIESFKISNIVLDNIKYTSTLFQHTVKSIFEHENYIDDISKTKSILRSQNCLILSDNTDLLKIINQLISRHSVISSLQNVDIKILKTIEKLIDDFGVLVSKFRTHDVIHLSDNELLTFTFIIRQLLHLQNKIFMSITMPFNDNDLLFNELIAFRWRFSISLAEIKHNMHVYDNSLFLSDTLLNSKRKAFQKKVDIQEITTLFHEINSNISTDNVSNVGLSDKFNIETL